MVGSTSNVPMFAKDYFFHYLFYNSAEVRLMIANYLTEYPVQWTNVLSNDEYGPTDDAKKMILDVVFNDDLDYHYDVEMQNGDIGREELVRFICYASKLLEKEVKKGENYNVKSIRMLIIYTGKPIEKFKHFTHHIEFMEKESCIILEDGPIHIQIIQTQRLEELSMDVIRKNSFYQFVHLFENEENHLEEQSDSVCKIAVEMYRRYLNSDDIIKYYQMERDRRYVNTEKDKSKREGIEIGREEGIEEGIEIGLAKANEELKKNMQKMIQAKYQDDAKWVEQCTSQQISKIFELAYDDLSYQEFKKKVLEE